jgi:hypothetical protein
LGCSGDDTEKTTETGSTVVTTTTTTPTTTQTTTTTQTDCTAGGTTQACLLYEADCTAGKEANYNGQGAWFDDTNEGYLKLTLAPNSDNRQLVFEVYTAELEVGTLYSMPNTLDITLRDETNPATTLLWSGCFGRLQITEYERGVSLSASWEAQAELAVGACLDTDYWTTEGAVFDAAPCAH